MNCKSFQSGLIKVSFYAGEPGVSENYINRCARQVFNKPAKEMLTETIIVQAQWELQDFTRSIAEIAYGLNFNDPFYFGRLFQQVMRSTPSEYRQCIMHGLYE